MTCYYPVPAYRSSEFNPNTGKRGLVFSSKHPLRLAEGKSFSVPCGRCTGCRLDRSQAWAIRCLHESQMHPENCFITLTYNQQSVPTDYSVHLDHFQDFMKRLRFAVEPTKIRFLACGEYGDQNLRPHYHALIFNYSFPDKKLITIRNNNPIYSSIQLAKLWTFGTHEIGNLTYKSAAYTARYSLKKIGGDKADEHYMRQSPVDGQFYRVASEFLVMSRRPGIGKPWFDRYKADFFPSDFLIIDGRKMKPPAFYLKLLAEEEAAKLKRARKAFARQHRDDSTPARLAVREKVQAEKTKLLKRTL